MARVWVGVGILAIFATLERRLDGVNFRKTSGVASHADVLRGSSRVPGTRDEPLRTSARKARTVTGNSYVAITHAKLVFLLASLKLTSVGRSKKLDVRPAANMVVKVPSLFFFFFFFFPYCPVLFLKLY